MVRDDRCRSIVLDCDEGKLFHSRYAVLGLARGPVEDEQKANSEARTPSSELRYHRTICRRVCWEWALHFRERACVIREVARVQGQDTGVLRAIERRHDGRFST